MSPRRFLTTPTETTQAGVRRLWVEIGNAVRSARLSRGWTVRDLAARAGVSKTLAYDIEAGSCRSLEAAVRLTGVLGLRLELDFVDTRRRGDLPAHRRDPVHSLMGEVEAAHLRPSGCGVGIDEPYQHFQFAGRADVVAWDIEARAFLHLENRTRFPDLQEMAGAFNSKRAYLGAAVAGRLGVRRWASETHVIVGLWSAEVMHALRERPESFRSICPDPIDAFSAWWAGQRPGPGAIATFVLLDPLASGRQEQLVGLDEALGDVRPRHRGYADVAAKLAAQRER